MARFIKTNANYWGKNIGDCMIRSVSFGTNLGYIAVCNMLGLKWKHMHGLVTKKGVGVSRLESNFVESGWIDEVYTDEIASNFFFGGDDGEKDDFIDPEVGDTVDEFLQMYAGQGRFLLYVRPPKSEVNKDDWHMVYANANNQKVFDTWDCRKWLVFGAYRIMKDKVPEDDPNSRQSEVARLRAQYMKAARKAH